MDNFQQHELKGRKKLESIFKGSHKVTNYEFTTGQYDRLDCFTTGATGALTAYEIKDRDINSQTYPNYILELSKLNALMEAKEKSGYTPYYINFFADNTILLWDVSKIDITNRVIKKWCTATTAENYGNRIQKDVILLQPSEGKIIRFNYS